ncbi:MAG: NADH-quinone oxidoreductase subunit C [Pseudomonadota bacterium]
MNREAFNERLLAEFGPDVVLGCSSFRDEITAVVEAGSIVRICRFLRDDPELAFDFLTFVGGVDRYRDQPRFEVVYQLYSIKFNHRCRIKALIPETEESGACIDSVFEVWPSADWHERETAEMFGITFNNHPDPRKLLLPEEWTVYPLRKDFPLEGTSEATPDLPHQG